MPGIILLVRGQSKSFTSYSDEDSEFTSNKTTRCQSGLTIRGVVYPGQFLFFQANFRKISIFSGNFTKKFQFSRQNLLIYSYFWQIILLLLKSHHNRTYFL